jgi:predicted nucleotidyltransferase
MELEIDRVELEGVCRQHGVAEIADFGSVVRGTQHAASYVDLMYSLTPDSRLDIGSANLRTS